MDARSEFLVYLGASLVTTAALFTLQIWYATYLDVEVAQAQDVDAPLDAKLQAVREAERGKLGAGAMPIADAMKAIAQSGRAASPKLAPQPSEDLSAMSGWIHRKGFAPYEPRPQVAPTPAEAVAPVEGAAVPAEGAAAGEAAAAAAPAPAAAKPAAPSAAAKAKITKAVVAKPAPAAPAAAPAPSAAPGGTP